MFYYWWDWTWLILLPAIALSLIAQARVSAAYNRYSRVATRAAARLRTWWRKCSRAKASKTCASNPRRGRMTDHYDPKALALRLSEGVYQFLFHRRAGHCRARSRACPAATAMATRR